MKIEKYWHPIFQFLYDLFGELPPHFKCFFNQEKNLTIVINSYLEDKREILVILERRVKPNDRNKVAPGGTILIQEEWRLNFEDGSVKCELEIDFKSFTGKAIKTTKGESAFCSPEEYNKKTQRWLGNQLDFVLKIIKESKRLDPYTGKILSEEEAKEFDKKMSTLMGEVEDFGAKISEQLRKKV